MALQLVLQSLSVGSVFLRGVQVTSTDILYAGQWAWH